MRTEQKYQPVCIRMPPLKMPSQVPLPQYKAVSVSYNLHSAAFNRQPFIRFSAMSQLSDDFFWFEQWANHPKGYNPPASDDFSGS